MPVVTVEIPGLLRDCTDGQALVQVDADTLGQAFTTMRRTWPTLGTHVFTETGEVRPHVLILFNGRATRWGIDPASHLSSGDRLQIVQAVSGG